MPLTFIPATDVRPGQPRYLVGTEWRAEQLIEEERLTPGSAPRLWAEPHAMPVEEFARLCGRDPTALLALVEA